MKNLIKAFLFVLVVACQPQNSGEEAEKKVDPQVIKYESMNAVSKVEAKENIDYYQTEVKKMLGADPVKAFTIASVDLVEAIGWQKEKRYDYVRIYMGLDEESKELKIYLTPVEGADLKKGIAGKDVFRSGKYEGEGFLQGDGPFMLDFSSPCPRTCPDPPL